MPQLLSCTPMADLLLSKNVSTGPHNCLDNDTCCMLNLIISGNVRWSAWLFVVFCFYLLYQLGIGGKT